MNFAETVGIYLLRLHSSVMLCWKVVKFDRKVQYYSKTFFHYVYESVIKPYGLSCIS